MGLNFLFAFDRFMADHDAWRELAEIYVLLANESYCLPNDYHVAAVLFISSLSPVSALINQVLYTLGGLENLQTARKYYSSTIDLTGGKNTRALFGICLCMSAIAQLSKGRNKEDKDCPDLQSLATAALEKEYKQRASGKLTVLTSAFKSLKGQRFDIHSASVMDAKFMECVKSECFISHLDMLTCRAAQGHISNFIAVANLNLLH
ncbi:Tetratricopeptide-like helical [Populus alba x Populus x berolinensis]|nr:Tetratricopeptide-like helical [Populus alba x Populus x berolinensis]